MRRISAGNNLSIELDDQRWRLLVNGDSRVLVDAERGLPLRYLSTFGARRKLPPAGNLPLDSIRRIVLGWAAKDESWHLGIMLSPELAEARGSRWCEVAHWPDPDRDVYVDLATEAGEKLAQMVGKPFELVPPTALPIPREQVIDQVDKALHAAGLPPRTETRTLKDLIQRLPLNLDDWRLLQTNAHTLELRWEKGMKTGRFLRVFWYTILAIVYVALSVATLRQGIALPNPAFLPYLGLASAVGLVGLAIYYLFKYQNDINRIVVDTEEHQITGYHHNERKWQYGNETIAAIYGSHVVDRKPREGVFSTHYGELNLYLIDGQFLHLLSSAQAEDLRAPLEQEAEEVVSLQFASDAETNLQIAGACIAFALGVNCLYDQRTK